MAAAGDAVPGVADQAAPDPVRPGDPGLRRRSWPTPSAPRPCSGPPTGCATSWGAGRWCSSPPSRCSASSARARAAPPGCCWPAAWPTSSPRTPTRAGPWRPPGHGGGARRRRGRHRRPPPGPAPGWWRTVPRRCWRGSRCGRPGSHREKAPGGRASGAWRAATTDSRVTPRPSASVDLRPPAQHAAPPSTRRARCAEARPRAAGRTRAPRRSPGRRAGRARSPRRRSPRSSSPPPGRSRPR